MEVFGMGKIALGLILGLTIGARCRLLDIPVPAPPKLVGAILVVAMTLGYIGTDYFITTQTTTEQACGGPSGQTVEDGCEPGMS
jgi:XapX domain-containing protein